MSRFALVRRTVVPGLTLEPVATASGVDPHMVDRLVALGLLDRITDREQALRAREGHRR